MKTFNIWLVGKARHRDFDYDCYGSGTRFVIGVNLRNMFNKVCAKTNEFSAANFIWDKGTPSPTDVVVYVLSHKSRSIIGSKGGQAIHESAAGGTFRYKAGMISEVYLKEIDGAASFAQLAANIIFHEIMHNKLDASVSPTVFDIHSQGGGGLAHHTVSAGTQLTNHNISLMARALPKAVRQYTGKMR